MHCAHASHLPSATPLVVATVCHAAPDGWPVPHLSRTCPAPAVCANINLFMEVNEEEMEKYLQIFVTDIWHLLMQVCDGTSMCALCVACWQ